MVSRPDTKKARAKRHKRVRSKVSGTASCPRLCVFRSRNNIYAQIIDDVAGVTLAQASSLDKSIEGNGGNKAAAKAVGVLVAERAKAKKKADTNNMPLHSISIHSYFLPHYNSLPING